MLLYYKQLRRRLATQAIRGTPQTEGGTAVDSVQIQGGEPVPGIVRTPNIYLTLTTGLIS